MIYGGFLLQTVKIG